MKVLIYELTNRLANSISDALTKNGVISYPVLELEKVIPMLESSEYRLALIDCSPSTFDNVVQVITAIRKDPKFQQIRLICHIKDPKVKVVEKFISLGVHGFITKPFDRNTFTTQLIK